MGFFDRHLVKAEGPDRFSVRLDEVEREVLTDVCSQLAEALDGGTDLPAFRRLFPVAHAQDPELEAHYRDLVHDELVAKRLEDLRAVVAGADATELDRNGLERWMTALNSVRLVFGTTLDVGEEDPGPLDPDDPETPALVVYHFLGQLLQEIVDALQSTL
jgi:hypothetical protein